MQRVHSKKVFTITWIRDMEEEFEKKISDVSNKKDVTGAICADSLGVCLSVRGVCSNDQAGFATTIIDRAKELASDSNGRVDVVVAIEFESRVILMKSFKAITLAVHKKIVSKDTVSH